MLKNVENKMEKFKFIFDNLKKYQNEKSIKFWEMGTDFFLYLKRWNSIVKFIRDNYLTKIEEECDFKIILNYNESLKRGFVSIEKVEENCNLLIVNDYFNGKLGGLSTLRQFFEFGVSFGYISIDNKFSENETFTLQNLEKIFDPNNENEMIDFAFEICYELWDYKTLRAYSSKDIFFTILFTYYFLDKNDIKENNGKNLRKIVGENIISFRDGSKRNIDEIIKAFQGKNSSAFGQTTLHNWHKNWEHEEKFEKLLDFIYGKIKNDWTFKTDSMQNEIIKYWNKNGRRNKQPLFRNLLLNSQKRYNENDDFFDRHDLKIGITNEALVEAAHILDFKYCKSEDDKYNEENGILIDPSIHKYFDKDIIALNEEGHIYIKSDLINEVEKVLNINFDNSIRLNKNILSEKTIEYIKKRNEMRKINLGEYEQLN